jgi:hypothetical protein
VPAHAAAVERHFDSADDDIRHAALALIPHFSDSKAEIDKLTGSLADEESKIRFQHELTNAIAR